MRAMSRLTMLLPAVVLVLGALLVAGCDGGDEQPDPTGTTSTTSTDGRTTPATVVRRRLLPPRREGEPRPANDRRDARRGAGCGGALLDGPTEGEATDGLASAIPAGTQLRDIAVADGVATVDLDGSFDDGGGSASMLGRVAQVVATLTRFPTVERVAFRIDGDPVEAIGGEGVAVDPPIGRAAIEGQTPQILVESPLPGDSVTSPIRLRGTANVFEATVSIDVRDANGKLSSEPSRPRPRATARAARSTPSWRSPSGGRRHGRRVRVVGKGRHAAPRRPRALVLVR